MINFKGLGMKIIVVVFGTLFSVGVIQAAFLTNPTSGDNLGNHIATENLKLNNFWLSNDGGNEGVFVMTNGNVGVGTNAPGQKLQVVGSVAATSFIGALSGNASTATSLSSNGVNCSSGYYPLGVNASGVAESCTLISSGSDIYWTGTATNLVAATGRTSLGLGSLATASVVTDAQVPNNITIDSATNANTVDGYHASTVSTVNTAAVRNVSGDINARLFRSEYDSTNATIGFIMTQIDTVSNNYIRPSTVAQVKASLGVGIATGGNADTVDGHHFNWSGQSGQPTWLWGGNDSTNMYVYNPSNFSVSSAGSATSASYLASNGANCSAGYYPLGVNAYGAAESCTLISSGSDVYWTGTATNLVAATGRSSLGLGSLATANSVTDAQVPNNITIDYAGSAGSAGILTGPAHTTGTDGWFRSSGATGWYNETYGGGWYMTDTAWIKAYNNKMVWAAYFYSESLGGYATVGHGTANYLTKWDGSYTQTNSLIYDNGTNVGIGTASPSYKLHVNGTAFSSGWYTASDSRFKTDVVELNNILPKVMNLRAVSFDWDRASFPEMNFPSEREYGFIAQEVEKEFPDIVRTDSDGYKSVMYDRFSTVLLGAIQEQQQEIDSLNQRMLILESKLGN